jgi:hypothetical protein
MNPWQLALWFTYGDPARAVPVPSLRSFEKRTKRLSELDLRRLELELERATAFVVGYWRKMSTEILPTAELERNAIEFPALPLRYWILSWKKSHRKRVAGAFRNIVRHADALLLVSRIMNAHAPPPVASGAEDAPS